MQNQSKRPEESTTALGDILSLPSFSLRQLAARWRCEEEDIADCIRTDVLTAHVLFREMRVTYIDLHNQPQRIQTTLDGHYRLPARSAVMLLDGPKAAQGRYDFYLVIHEPDRLGVLVAGGRLIESFFHLDHLARREDLRVTREEVARVEATAGASVEPEIELRNSQRHRERCRGAAAVIWAREPALGIKELIENSPEFETVLESIANESPSSSHKKVAYTYRTLHGWIHDLCPDARPGPKPKRGA